MEELSTESLLQNLLLNIFPADIGDGDLESALGLMHPRLLGSPCPHEYRWRFMRATKAREPIPSVHPTKGKRGVDRTGAGNIDVGRRGLPAHS